MGRPPLEESLRTYFMKKDVEYKEAKGQKTQMQFAFILESTEQGEKLIDAYVGVEFSIVYKIIITAKARDGRDLYQEAQFYVACPGAGI